MTLIFTLILSLLPMQAVRGINPPRNLMTDMVARYKSALHKHMSGVGVLRSPSWTLKVVSSRREAKVRFDRYGYNYHYRQAPRGTRFAVLVADVEREDTQNRLPAMCSYTTDSAGNAHPHGIMKVDFYRWSSHRSYLGLSADYLNDFQYARRVRVVYSNPVPDDGSAIISPCGFPMERISSRRPRHTYPTHLYSARADELSGAIGSVLQLSRDSIIRVR